MSQPSYQSMQDEPEATSRQAEENDEIWKGLLKTSPISNQNVSLYLSQWPDESYRLMYYCCFCCCNPVYKFVLGLVDRKTGNRKYWILTEGKRKGISNDITRRGVLLQNMLEQDTEHLLTYQKCTFIMGASYEVMKVKWEHSVGSVAAFLG